jgi:hypothetical protein
VGERAAERPSRPSSRSRGHAERRAAAPEAPRGATSTDSVKRGVLPSGSREAYPDQ